MVGSEFQLPLNVQLRDEATLDNYLPAPAVAPLIQALLQQVSGQGEPLIFVYGPPDSGKSHLMQASCHAMAGALYLPLAVLRGHPPESVLQRVEHRPMLCLDDVQAVAGDESWEVALFHAFNRAREAGCRLLVAADAPPRALALGLDDLRSRLGWGIVYQLPAADDERRYQVLRFRARRRGLNMTDDVARYILSRAPRGMGALLELLEQLDRLSLARQRALTVPFVKAALNW